MINWQEEPQSPLWYKVVTWVLVIATFVVFFILIYPFFSAYIRYFQGQGSPAEESFSVVSLPDVSNIRLENGNTGSSTNSGSQKITSKPADKISFYVRTSNLKIDAPIVEGVSQQALYHGIGHHPGTPWPNEKKGNVILTGHSSWIDPANPYGFVFKNLSRLKVGEQIEIKYPERIYRYKVVGRYVVEPDDISLFGQNVKVPTLTVYTCSPVYTDWQRLVYVAELIE